MHQNLSDKDLLKLLTSGSETGFNEICRRYTRRLYLYCQRYTRSRFDIENLVQDILMGVWAYRDRIDPEGGLEPLLMSIARRRCVDMVRETVNSPVYEDFVEYRDSVADDSGSELEYEEYSAHLRELIRKLPDNQRLVIELSRFHYLSNDEIARELGISEKTVRNRISLGLRRLRVNLGYVRMLILPAVMFAELYGGWCK